MIKNEPGAPIAKSEELIVNIEPPFVTMQPDETFQTKIPVSWQSGKRVFPTLVISRLPDTTFTKVTIHLGGEFDNIKYHTTKYKIVPHEAEHELEITNQIDIPKSSPYAPQGPAPTPVQENIPTPPVPTKS
jgi:hypothetical protein